MQISLEQMKKNTLNQLGSLQLIFQDFDYHVIIISSLFASKATTLNLMIQQEAVIREDIV